MEFRLNATIKKNIIVEVKWFRCVRSMSCWKVLPLSCKTVALQLQPKITTSFQNRGIPFVGKCLILMVKLCM